MVVLAHLTCLIIQIRSTIKSKNWSGGKKLIVSLQIIAIEWASSIQVVESGLMSFVLKPSSRDFEVSLRILRELLSCCGERSLRFARSSQMLTKRAMCFACRVNEKIWMRSNSIFQDFAGLSLLSYSRCISTILITNGTLSFLVYSPLSPVTQHRRNQPFDPLQSTSWTC